MSRKLTIMLRGIILQSGETVTIAAKKLRVGRPTLSNLLNGNSSLSLEMAARIEEVYKYSGYALLQEQLKLEWENYVITEHDKIRFNDR